MNFSSSKKRVVISAINFTEGGPLTILRDCLNVASRVLPNDWEIIALVHKESLFDSKRIKYISFSSVKTSWLSRLVSEWIIFRWIFRKHKVDLWLSLHDITPLVKAKRQAVYCHNPSPFYKISFREAVLEPRFWLFNRFYIYIYRCFIRRNSLVIVQQNWIRNEFLRRFGPLPLVVAHPDVKVPHLNVNFLKKINNEVFIILYPTLPRVFKNVETIMEAMKLLSEQGHTKLEFRVTFSGNENSYARWLFATYGNIPGINFIGRQSTELMEKNYIEADAVVFPSKLETWGLPISEAKKMGKSLLVADLPYARETVGDYSRVKFISPTNINAWSTAISSMSRGNLICEQVFCPDIPEPFVPSWDQLWELLVRDL